MSLQSFKLRHQQFCPLGGKNDDLKLLRAASFLTSESRL